MINLHFSDILGRGLSSLSFQKEIASYNHTISANIGYDSASISITVGRTDMLDLAEYLIGKSIEVYHKDTSLIWSGFVNDVSISYGLTQVTFGPLLDVSNKVLVKYTEYTTGVPGVTTYANDLESQTRYGLTIYKILNAGSVSSTNAEKIRDRYLFENSYHKSNKTVSSSGSISFNINCLGYYHILNTYIYNYNGTTTGVSTKLQNVITDQPNDIYKLDFSQIESNTLSVSNLEKDDRYANEIISELINLGNNTNNDRTIFGIKDKIPYYRTIDYKTKYYIENNSKYYSVTNELGGIVEPWNIEPGYFMEVVGNVPYQWNYKENQRISFVESVTYTYPYQFQITSGLSGTLAQQLAKLGLGGL